MRTQYGRFNMFRKRLSRRRFLGTSASVAAAVPFLAKPSFAGNTKVEKSPPFPVIAISSGNGREATRTAYQAMLQGDDTLDAVIAGVNLVENDPEDTSVGLGGLPNEQGIVELDSAVMHGPTHRAGSVAAIRNIRNPSKVARDVMNHTDHVLIVGAGALQFAKAMGYKEENLLTEKARKIWLEWKQNLSPKDDWLSPKESQVYPVNSAYEEKRQTGTIHCAGLNAKGEMSCVTTTSGLAFKIPGRVGDSPIIGAGLYVDNEIGSCGSTGRGEANLQNLCCFAAVELMRNGMEPEDAGLEILRRVVHHTTESHLLNARNQPNFQLSFYLLCNDGKYAGVSMYGPSQFSVTDAGGTRLEKCAYLFEYKTR